MNILKFYVSNTGNKLKTENLILNQNSYYNTLELYTEDYYSEVVCTFRNSNGDMSPKCHMIYKGKDNENYKYEFPIPYQLTSFAIPGVSGRLETSFTMYKNNSARLVYPTVTNTTITVNKSNNTSILDNSYNGTDVENLWKAVGELLLRSTPDGGGKQDMLIPGKYIEITDDNIINVLPIDYSYITNKPIIPTKLSELENDTNFSTVLVENPTDESTILKGITIDGINYKVGSGDLSLTESEVSGATPVKNIYFEGKNWFVGGITDAEKQDIQDQLDLKANKSEVYSITTMDNLLLTKVNVGDIYSKETLDSKFNDKADKLNTYTQTEVNDKLALKADKSEVYTQSEINSKLETKVDSQTLTDNYYNKSQVDDKLTSALVYKGSVETFDDLPKTKNKVGDFWNVLADDVNYAWDGKKWDKIGGAGTTDLSDYYTIEQVDAKDKALQDNINLKVNTSDYEAYKKEVEGSISSINTKFNDYYTSVTVDSLLGDKANASEVYTITQVNNLLKDKADSATTYTMDQVNDLLSKKQPVGDYTTPDSFKTINNESIIGSGNIDTGTNVVANPMLDGTETFLDGIEVSGTKYKVGHENMTFSETAVPGAYQLRNININGDNWGIPEGGSQTDISYADGVLIIN